MTKIDSKRALITLMIAHCAGMLDLVALPIWVTTLITHYHFDPQQAGGLATLFLIGAAGASIYVAPKFNRLPIKFTVVVGFGVASLALLFSGLNYSFYILAILHFIGGISAGTALSITHGTIGHTKNPHRVFGLAGLAIGIFGVILLGSTPHLIEKFGGSSMFFVLASVLFLATLASFFFFPKVNQPITQTDQTKKLPPLGKAVWFCMMGVALLALTQAMTVSFYARIGLERGFGQELVTLALIIYGILTIFPAPLAALLQNKLSVTAVLIIGPIFQGIFSLVATHTHDFVTFAIAGPMMAFTILFIHTFAFGLLARLDLTGRAVAATPAMLMVGAAIGPFIAGTLVKFVSFESIAYVGCIFVVMQIILFNFTRKNISPEHDVNQAQFESKPSI